MASKINYFCFLLLVLFNVLFFNLVLGDPPNGGTPPPSAPASNTSVPASPTPPSTTPSIPGSDPSVPASPPSPPPSSTTPPNPSSNTSVPASPTTPSSTPPPGPSSNPSVPASPTPPSPISNPSVPASAPPPSSTTPPRCNCSLGLITKAACSVMLSQRGAPRIHRRICCKGLLRLTQEDLYSCLCYIVKSNSAKKPELPKLTMPDALEMVSRACSF